MTEKQQYNVSHAGASACNENGITMSFFFIMEYIICILFCRNARFEKFSSLNWIPFMLNIMLHCMKNRLRIEGRPKYVQRLLICLNLKALFKYHT